MPGVLCIQCSRQGPDMLVEGGVWNCLLLFFYSYLDMTVISLTRPLDQNSNIKNFSDYLLIQCVVRNVHKLSHA